MTQAGPDDRTDAAEAPGGGADAGARRLAALALERGLATDDEVESCEALCGTGGAGALGRILVAERVVTPRQLERLVAELEAEDARQRLPGYRIHKIIGKGGGGTVLKATQESLGRPVAIKVLPKRLSSHEASVEALYAEGRAAASLDHPGIVRAIDVGRAGECHYFVMEFVEGRTVKDLLTERGPLDEEEALGVAIAVAEALEHAHARGLLHRDIKPSNIIIGPDGAPRLADFGLALAIEQDAEASLAEAGDGADPDELPIGTPLYMSPEQTLGASAPVGPASDVYSLGATLYHMLTGEPPFRDTSRERVMRRHREEAPVPVVERNPEVEHGLSEVVDSMLAKDPARRYPSCEALLAELRAWKAMCLLRRGERERGAG